MNKKLNEISTILKKKRHHLKKRYGSYYSQSSVAKKVKVHPQFISNIERGLHPPPIYLLKRLFALYELDLKLGYKLLLQEKAMELKKQLFSK